jgi:hypothetical protein
MSVDLPAALSPTIATPATVGTVMSTYCKARNPPKLFEMFVISTRFWLLLTICSLSEFDVVSGSELLVIVCHPNGHSSVIDDLVCYLH